ncbi:hypothetical protein MMC30_000308 [Trapelia coarctata]|nr:hypothetical protein [Trapelia coarctata]
MAAKLATIGILSIGDMGRGIANLLIANGYKVLTNASDRSRDTQNRARSASIALLPTDEALIEQSNYILSVVPPRDAYSIATRILAAFHESHRRYENNPLYFLDLNAISPSTAQNIASLFSAIPAIRLLDGGIIGHPPKLSSPSPTSPSSWYKPSIVLSGPYPLQDAPLNGADLASILNIKHISSDIGPASGLKMCFASMNKGFTAIALQAYTTAEKLGVLPELQAHLKEYTPAIGAAAEKSLVGMPPKAYRWVAEMEEIASTMEEYGGFSYREDEVKCGRGGDLFKGVGDVYRFVAEETELGKEKVGQRKIGMTPEDVARRCGEDLERGRRQSLP